jgi:hypothetical protein
METKLFNAEDARKLAKEVKDKKELLAKQEQEDKKQSIAKSAEPIINKALEEIKQAINDNKEYIKVDLTNYDKNIENFVVSKFKELGFIINRVTGHINSPKSSIINIRWEEDEKMIYVKTGKDEDHEKIVSDFIKSLKKDKQYFEHKPVYCFHENFPTEFFL